MKDLHIEVVANGLVVGVATAESCETFVFTSSVEALDFIKNQIVEVKEDALG